MKKVFFLLGSLAICLFSWTVAEQFNASYFNFLIDKKVENKSNLEDKKLFLQQILGLLESPEFEQSEFSSLFKQVRIHCDEVLNQLQNNQEKNKKKTETSLDLEGIDEEKVREAVLSRHNEERKNNGLSELKIDSEVQRVARIKAQDMNDNNYFAHESPTYGTPFNMLKNFGISYKSAGENLAGNSSNSGAVNAWMNSSGHRANILNSSYNYTGLAVVSSPKYGKIYVQMFIGR